MNNEIDNEIDIKKGDKFIALVNFYMDCDDVHEEIKYKRGKVYESHVNGCITNEQGNKLHHWPSLYNKGVEIFEKYNILANPANLNAINNDQAMRFNSEKPKLSLIDLKSLEPMAEVLEFGAKKYARDNWKKGFSISTILDSMLRHIAAIQDGEMIDPESGLSHIGHIQCNALFLGGKNNTNDLTKNGRS